MRLFLKSLRNFEPFVILPQLFKWLLISLVIAGAAGTASALFLKILDESIALRESHPWILGFLPLGGFVVGWMYFKMGKSVEAGNNLLIEEIHDPKKVISFRMTPLILFGTVVSHLLGASVGREGTAVQMAGSLADQINHFTRLNPRERRILLMAGMSAGFSSVFGTPLAGAFFGLEVLSIGKVRYDAIFPCFVAALAAHEVTLAWGIHHTEYRIFSLPSFTLVNLLAILVAGILFGLTGMSFVKATHSVKKAFEKHIPYPPARPLIGGLIFVATTLGIQSTRYLSLGVPTLVEAFAKPLPIWDCLLKFFFTILCLGSGFKGGEVTPLFFIGATLGNSLSLGLPLPHDILAGLGFVGVFAGAANTPLASSIMAIELLGPQIGGLASLACVVSYLFSGNAGIYHTQRKSLSKVDHLNSET